MGTSSNQWLRRNELDRIRSLPIPMSQKRKLKAKLENLPVNKLGKMDGISWWFSSTKERLKRKWRKLLRTNVVWQKSLQDIEIRGGTSIINVFLFIKWTIYYNIFVATVIFLFMILPYAFLRNYENDIQNGTVTCPSGFSFTDHEHNKKLQWTNNTFVKLQELSICCRQETHVPLENDSLLNTLVYSFVNSPFTYEYFSTPKLDVLKGHHYDFQQAYLVVVIAIFLGSLVIMIWQIGKGIKEMTISRKGEFYKFSNLVFAGWDHYTSDRRGAKFRHKILRTEIKVALYSERRHFLKVSKEEQFKTYMKRIIGNIIVILVICLMGMAIYYATDYSLYKDEGATLDFHVLRLVPAIVIGLCNIIFPIFLKFLRKFENYSYEVQTAISLIRTLIVRIIAIGFAAMRYYSADYCEKEAYSCTVCIKQPNSFGNGKLKEKSHCWESKFAVHIYLIVLVDLAIKFLLMVADFTKVLIGKHAKIEFLQATTRFNLVRHSLDVIYINSLSSFFYFAPLLPFMIAIYCTIMAYLKKFALMTLSHSVPDSFRATRSTAIYVSAKLLAFIAVSFSVGAVITSLEPSRSCGPFLGQRIPLHALNELYSKINLPRTVFYFFTSQGLAILLIILLGTFAYYYYAKARAHRTMVEILRHMLILEGHDKQYLFARLNTLREEAEKSIQS